MTSDTLLCQNRGRSIAWTILAVTLAGYVAFAAYVVPRVGATGDEPAYLTIAQSLIKDGDVDVANNYADGDYRPYYAWQLEPAISGNSRPGHGYSIFSPGLPILLLPAFVIGGASGDVRLAASLFMSLIMSLVAVNIYLAALEMTGKRRVALATWALMAFSIPLLSHAFQIYPDVVAALIVVYVLRQVLKWQALGNLKKLWVAALLGYLMWCHPKNLISVALLLGMALLQLVRSRRSLKDVITHTEAVALVAPVAGSFLLLLYANYRWYGRWSPIGAFLGGENVSLAALSVSWWGLLLDRTEGLLLHMPILLVAIVGLIVLVLRRRAEGTCAAAILVAGYGLISLSPAWWVGGGGGLPHRHLISILPVLAFPLSYGISLVRSRIVLGSILVAGAWGLALSLVSILAPENMHGPGFVVYDWGHLFPDSKAFDATQAVLLVTWIALYLSVLAWAVAWEKTVGGRSADRLHAQAFPAIAFALAGLCLVQAARVSRTEFVAHSAATWYADAIASLIGHVVDDASATTGRARVTDQSGWLGYGQNWELPSGRWHVIFRLKHDDAPVGTQLGHIDVTDDRGRKTLGALSLVAGGVTEYQDYVLNINSRGERALEFRVRSSGATQLWLDSIRVVPFMVDEVDSVGPSSGVWLDHGTWEAGAPPTAHTVGDIVSVDTRSGGQALCSGEGSGWLVYGPYVWIRPGSYRVVYQLGLGEEVADEVNVATLDVVTAAGNHQLVQRVLTGADFESVGDYELFVVPMRSQGQCDFEFRVFAPGNADLCVDTVSVEPIRD